MLSSFAQFTSGRTLRPTKPSGNPAEDVMFEVAIFPSFESTASIPTTKEAPEVVCVGTAS